VTVKHVPILMYHQIGEPSETKSRMAVSPAAFAAQLAYLYKAGFKTITTVALSEALTRDTEDLPDQTVVLTFDDGYENFYSRAMPLLAQYGFTATVFVTTGWIQDAGTKPVGKRPGGMLNWSQITEVALAGLEVGAHSHRHPQLDRLPQRPLHEELYTSKERLEDKLGIRVAGLAYPYGYSNTRVRQVARDVGYGYSCAVTNAMAGRTSDLFALPRLTVRHSTTMRTFHQIITGSIPVTLRKDRALTKGWAVVRRARATLNLGSRAM
jgi:peptidoglycan/xylan/chitin deacetylase (PgdA/CDA1 family)